MSLRRFLQLIGSSTGVFLLAGSLSGTPARDHAAIRVWAHQGQEAENEALRQVARDFNDHYASRGWQVALTFFPDFQFTEKIAVAAAVRDLPDVLDIDGPMLARYVDAALLAPLDRWFSPAELTDFLPTIRRQGTNGGRLFALGAFDSAVVLYYDREMLSAAGVAPPAGDAAWTWAEFLEACRRLRASGVEPLALHMNESADEWFTYAFSPVLWSAGGDLISADGRRTRGVLDRPENIRALAEWQKLFQQGFASADPVDPDPFGNGKVAMDWSGHWMARSHLEKKRQRLGVMPLPRMGSATVAPCGSWCWGLSIRSSDPEAAAAWIRWATDAEHGIAPIVRANGAVPARQSAFAAFPEYRTDPYLLFRRQLENTARPRPSTPYYATLTQHFAAAVRDIARGSEPASRLATAAAEIQRVIDRRELAAGSTAREGGVTP